MERLDELVLDQLANNLFTPGRLQLILAQGRQLLQSRTAADRQKLMQLQGELRQADKRLNRLYEAVESGFVALDETLQRRLQQAKAAREAVLVEMAGLRRLQMLPAARILPSQVQAFSKIVRSKLRDRSSSFGRDYLRAVVDRVVVHEKSATISGSHARLMQMVADGKAGADRVPSCDLTGMDRKFVARPERFELPTPWFVARCSIQLSYGRAV